MNFKHSSDPCPVLVQGQHSLLFLSHQALSQQVYDNSSPNIPQAPSSMTKHKKTRKSSPGQSREHALNGQPVLPTFNQTIPAFQPCRAAGLSNSLGPRTKLGIIYPTNYEAKAHMLYQAICTAPSPHKKHLCTHQ